MPDECRRVLLHAAAGSIRAGLQGAAAPAVRLLDCPDLLRASGASFVTLRSADALRGCIGTLTAVRPLVQDVSDNAYAAAFRDTRFAALRTPDAVSLHIQVSILSEPSYLHFESEQDLLQQLRPGVDGLVLEEGACRSTFLPAVWESLPRPVAFLRHLKEKAGLPADYWSEAVRVQRYVVESFGGDLSTLR